ncbi:MAG: Ig-like domain-containing protein, partial [Dysgonamonadaceae bacterium]|nr:Ig-like domain-containing protein [Dysgonamonadaceae bacterium]
MDKKTKKWKVCLSILLLGGLLMGSLPAFSQDPFNIVMSFYQDPATKMAFNWHTAASNTTGEVQVVEGAPGTANFSTPLKTKTASIEGPIFSSSATVFKAVIDGLSPGTIYSFRVGKAGAWSKTGTFTTAKASKDNFSFIYFTDPQSTTQQDFDIFKRTAKTANGNHGDAKFWLACGDFVNTADNKPEWDGFFNAFVEDDIFLKKPFLPVQGNHDVSDNTSVARFRSHFHTEDVAFDDATALSQGSVYSFVYGDALFLAMSFEKVKSGTYDDYLRAVATWIKQECAKYPDVRWRIAFFHKGVYTGSNADWGSHQDAKEAKSLRDIIAPVLYEEKIDLALQGHSHVYEVIGPIKNDKKTGEFNKFVSGSVTNVKGVLPDDLPSNRTGKKGGIYNVQDGTLFFLNNASGTKTNYLPRTKTEMNNAFSSHGVTNYYDLFTGCFAQPSHPSVDSDPSRFNKFGSPTYSNVEVTTDTIFITTYEVIDNSGAKREFDKIKVAKTPISTDPVDVTGVSLNKNTTSLKVGLSEQLTATITPSNATNKNVTWNSSNPSVATVSSTGLVTALTEGGTTITVTTKDGNKTAQCVVTVTPKSPGITELTFEADNIGQLYFTDRNGSNAPQTANVQANPNPSGINTSSQSLKHEVGYNNTVVGFDIVLPAGKIWADVTAVSFDIYCATSEISGSTSPYGILIGINEWRYVGGNTTNSLCPGSTTVSNTRYPTSVVVNHCDDPYLWRPSQITTAGTWKTLTISAVEINNNITRISPSLDEFTLYLGVQHEGRVGSEVPPANTKIFYYDNIKVVLKEVAPVANFTVTDLGSGKRQFIDTSTDAAEWLWDFGDGTTSTDQHPLHTYSASGTNKTYTVKLTAKNAVGEHSVTKTVTVLAVEFLSAPVADFEIEFIEKRTYQFVNTSVASPDTEWLWDFGDGSTSTEKNPEHTYTYNSMFTITLTATNAVGEDEISRSQAVFLSETPVIDPVWHGGFDTSWDNLDNWVESLIPTVEGIVTILGDAFNFPVLTEEVEV